MLGLPLANQAFAEDGSLIDAKMQARLEALIGKFLTFAMAVATAQK
jgi:hypothetical protein